jgi:hypothetical protein
VSEQRHFVVMVGRFKVGHQKRGEADHECGHGGWLYTPYLSLLRDSFTLRLSEHDCTPQCVSDVRFRKYLSV